MNTVKTPVIKFYQHNNRGTHLLVCERKQQFGMYIEKGDEGMLTRLIRQLLLQLSKDINWFLIVMLYTCRPSWWLVASKQYVAWLKAWQAKYWNIYYALEFQVDI